MKFLNNDTDRLIISYLAKSMSFMDLCKAVGKIPIRKLVHQEGKKPFIQTFYVSPDEVKHLNLKTGDKVHNIEKPVHPSTPEKSVQHTVITNNNNLIDSTTKINGNLSKFDKTYLKEYTDSIGERLFQELKDSYEFIKERSKNPFIIKDNSDQLYESLKNFPKVLRVEPHIDTIDVKAETATISYNLNLTGNEKSLILDIIIRGVQGKGKQIGLYTNVSMDPKLNFKAHGITQNPDGTYKLTLQLSLKNITEPYKQNLQEQLTSDYINQIFNNLNNTSVTSKAKSSKEKQLGLDKLSQRQLAVARTVGICSDAKDIQATEYLENMCRHYLTIKSNIGTALKNVKTFNNALGFKTVEDNGYKTFSEISDIINTYSQSLNTLANSTVEDNEVKCKISTVSSEVHKKISQKILDDWDMTHHGHFKPVISGIYRVDNIDVDEDFNNKVDENEQYFGEQEFLGKNSIKDEFYHGTDSFATTMILGHSGRFKISPSKAGKCFGIGIYLADKSSKSAQYIGTSFRNKDITGTLMICDATLGDCVEIHNKAEFKEICGPDLEEVEDLESSLYEDYTAVAVEGGEEDQVVDNNEFCVFDPNSVRPKFLVEMKVVNTKEETQ